MKRSPVACLALVLVYALSAEWLGSVAGITGAYLLGYVFAGSEYKADVERSFYALGHGLLIPLFFVSIGLSSDYRALVGSLDADVRGAFRRDHRQGGRLRIRGARFGNGLGAKPSSRLRHDVARRSGLDRHRHGCEHRYFREAEVAVMVAVVLLTTLLTPIALRGAFQLKSEQDIEEGLRSPRHESDRAEQARH